MPIVKKGLEKFLGGERFERVRNYSFYDFLTNHYGKNKIMSLELSLHHSLIDKKYKNKKIDFAAKKTYEFYGRFAEGGVYDFSIEATALNLFSLAVAIPYELWYVNLGGCGCAKTRTMGLFTNTVFGKPYGIWNDYIWKKSDTNENSFFLKKWAADTFAFAIGQLPIYWTNLSIAGADWDKIWRASLIAFAAGPLGIPYGWIRRKMRKSAGLSVQAKKNHKTTKLKNLEFS